MMKRLILFFLLLIPFLGFSQKVTIMSPASGIDSAAIVNDSILITWTDGLIFSQDTIRVLGAAKAGNGLKSIGDSLNLGGVLSSTAILIVSTGKLFVVSDNVGNQFFSLAPTTTQIGSRNGAYSTVIGVGFGEMNVVAGNNGIDSVKFLISPTGIKMTDSRIVEKGIEYDDDYSAGFSERSLPDVGHVAAMIADSIANIQSATRPDTIEVTLYHTAVGSVIAAGASEHFQAVPSEWNGAIIVKVHYQQFVTGTVATNVGLEITADGGGVTNPFTGAIGIGNKNVVVTGSTALSTGDAIQVDVPSGTPDGQGLVAVLKIVMP